MTRYCAILVHHISPGIVAESAKCVLFTGFHLGVREKSDASADVEQRMRRRMLGEV